MPKLDEATSILDLPTEAFMEPLTDDKQPAVESGSDKGTPPPPKADEQAVAPEPKAEPPAPPESEAKTEQELTGEPEAVSKVPELEPQEPHLEPVEPEKPQFDYRQFAVKYDVGDPSLYRNCTSEDEALRLAAQQLAHFRRVYGSHTREVGEARKRISELEAELAKHKTESSTTSSPPSVEGTLAGSMSEEERAAFLEKLEEQPEAVFDEYRQKAVQEALRKVQETLEERERERALREADAQIAREFEAFTKECPNWKERADDMRSVFDEIGTAGATITYPQVYQLAQLKAEAPTEYRSLTDRLAKGYDFDDAVRLSCSSPETLLSPKARPVKESELTPARGGRAQMGPRSTSKGMPHPITSTQATSIAELPNAGDPY